MARIALTVMGLVAAFMLGVSLALDWPDLVVFAFASSWSLKWALVAGREAQS